MCQSSCLGRSFYIFRSLSEPSHKGKNVNCTKGTKKQARLSKSGTPNAPRRPSRAPQPAQMTPKRHGTPVLKRPLYGPSLVWPIFRGAPDLICRCFLRTRQCKCSQTRSIRKSWRGAAAKGTLPRADAQAGGRAQPFTNKTMQIKPRAPEKEVMERRDRKKDIAKG